MSTSPTMALYQRLTRIPVIGHRLFSIGFSLKAPYFRTVRPLVTVMRPHYCEVRVPRRWSVGNHIGTVHAIAVCNGLEAAMGLLAEATTPAGRRWIPKAMEVTYTAKATTDITCVAETGPADWDNAGDVRVRVRAERADGTIVTQGTITIWISDRRQSTPR